VSPKTKKKPKPKKPSKFKAIPVPGLFKMGDGPGAAWQQGKVSELILEFARPLMYADPEGPPDIETLRQMMKFVCICWNLPMLEGKEGAEVKKHLDLLEQVPPPIKKLVDGLMRDRRTKFGSIPFLVTVEVRGTNMDDAVIRAEARMDRPVDKGMN
jgi:hypothetical protein